MCLLSFSSELCRVWSFMLKCSTPIKSFPKLSGVELSGVQATSSLAGEGRGLLQQGLPHWYHEIHLNGLQTCRTSSAPAGIVVYMLNKMGEFLLYLARSDLFSKFPAIKCLEKSRNVQQCLLPRPELQSHHAAHCVEAGGEVCGAVAEPRQQGPDLVINVLKMFSCKSFI